jgi:regulator of cell morphogenesis and NO signaling
MEEALKQRKIGEIVTEDFRTAEVFREFGLDFCCGGDKTVEEACRGNDVDPDKVEEQLMQLGDREVASSQHFDLWPLDFLIDYIVNNHHAYTRNKLPEIDQYARKVARVHGERHPELNQICELVTKLQDEIFDHLEKEEKILFPYVKRLVKADKGGKRPESDRFSQAADPIEMMENEHEEAGDKMQEIRELSADFSPPEDACTTYKLLYENLAGFEKDLHNHIHLENNILFPKALKLEEKLR